MEWRDGAIHGGPTLARGVDGFFSRVNTTSILFTHACTIKNPSSEIVFNSSLGHLSGPDILSGYRRYSTYFAMSGLVSAPRNLPCVPLAVLYASFFSLASAPALLYFLCCAGNLWGASITGRRQLAFVYCARQCPAGHLHRPCSRCPNSSS